MVKQKITSIRLNDVERRVLSENAALYGLTMTAYLKRVAMKQRLIQPIFSLEEGAHAHARLDTIGRDLNSCAHVMHSSRFKGGHVSDADLKKLYAEVIEVRNLVHDLSSEIVARRSRNYDLSVSDDD
ncbi:plasmid mobilization protein [Lacticaseibacillus jixiensis]|uniref:plasmid mobilization protein n=1 Tax=Lacticaseibacillus jixiensis TaxID=3231926 RepID=UPI0036F2901C